VKQYTTNGKTHYLFESTTEAIELLQKDEWSYLNINNQSLEWTVDEYGRAKSPFRHWAEGLTEYDKYIPPKVGDWICSDDGFIVQVLDIWIRPHIIARGNGAKKERKIYCYPDGKPRFNVIVKTACATVNAVNNKDGSWNCRKLIINFKTLQQAYQSSTSLATEPREFGKHLTYKKRLFAYYCCVYLNPVKAYWEVNNYSAKFSSTVDRIKARKIVVDSLELLKDKYVIKEIKTYMDIQDFKNKLKDSLEKEGLGIDRAVKSLRLGLEANETNPKKTGGLGHRAFIKDVIDVNKFVDDLDAKNLDMITEEKGSISKSSNKMAVLPASHAENMPLPMPNKEIIGKVKKSVIEEITYYNENLDKSKEVRLKDVD